MKGEKMSKRIGLFSEEQFREIQKCNPYYFYNEKSKELANKIENIKGQELDGIIKIGEYLCEFKNTCGEAGPEYYNKFLRNPKVKLGKTQAKKYIAVYKYYSSQVMGCQSTDILKKLGIEKIYLIMQVENAEVHKYFIQYIIKWKINVKMIKVMINQLNNGKTLKEVCNWHLKICQMKKGLIEMDYSILPEAKPKVNYYKMYQKILVKSEILEEENQKLRQKIALLEKGVVIPKELSDKLPKYLQEAQKKFLEVSNTSSSLSTEDLREQQISFWRNEVNNFEQKYFNKKVNKRLKEKRLLTSGEKLIN